MTSRGARSLSMRSYWFGDIDRGKCTPAASHDPEYLSRRLDWIGAAIHYWIFYTNFRKILLNYLLLAKQNGGDTQLLCLTNCFDRLFILSTRYSNYLFLSSYPSTSSFKSLSIVTPPCGEMFYKSNCITKILVTAILLHLRRYRSSPKVLQI